VAYNFVIKYHFVFLLGIGNISQRPFRGESSFVVGGARLLGYRDVEKAIIRSRHYLSAFLFNVDEHHDEEVYT
jgi:hypothetical protein